MISWLQWVRAEHTRAKVLSAPLLSSITCCKSIKDCKPSHERIFWSVKSEPDPSAPIHFWLWHSCLFPSFLGTEIRLILISFFHNLTASCSDSPFSFICWIWFSISFRMVTLCRRRRCVLITTSTIASNLTPKSMQPLLPVISNNLPYGVQISNQKEVVSPFWVSDFENPCAMPRYFKSFFHIQEPHVLFSFTDQRDPFCIR